MGKAQRRGSGCGGRRGVRRHGHGRASRGGGAGAHGDKPPRALGGGQWPWRGCGVWMESWRWTRWIKEMGGPSTEPKKKIY